MRKKTLEKLRACVYEAAKEGAKQGKIDAYEAIERKKRQKESADFWLKFKSGEAYNSCMKRNRTTMF